jgi:hypothetical protein
VLYRTTGELGQPTATVATIIKPLAPVGASEHAPACTPELHVVGVAEGGIPVDFAHSLTYVNGDNDAARLSVSTLVNAITRSAWGIDLRACLGIGSPRERLRPLWITGTLCCVAHPGLLMLVASAQSEARD